MAGRVEGKIALIIGGAQGLGEAASRMLAREGARVAMSDVNVAGAESDEDKFVTGAEFKVYGGISAM